MTNQELKKIISEMVIGDEELLDQIIILEGDEFADGFIGLSTDNNVVYSYEKLVESLSKQDDWDETSAIEWLDYNTLRALPYITEGIAPIIIHEPIY
jgi:hypothetical protein